MPLDVQIKTKTYKFEKMSLPYENRDFDFETIKKFADYQGQDEGTEKGGKLKRKNSNDTLLSQTVATPRGSTKLDSVGDMMSVKSGGYKNKEEPINYKALTSS